MIKNAVIVVLSVFSLFLAYKLYESEKKNVNLKLELENSKINLEFEKALN